VGARTIVVTGSASGIGAAVAASAAAQGERVIGIDLHDADVIADLSSVTGRAAMVAGVRERSGGVVDGVVACAGTMGASAVAVNYFGMVATLAGLRPLLAESDAPRAVGVASMASVLTVDETLVELCLEGEEPAAIARNGADYPSSKAAFCRWIRRNAPSKEWAGSGIPLNAVAPGVVATAMMAPFLRDPTARAELETQVPMPLGGYALPENIAPLALFLAGVENTHVTGQVVFIDGGADAVVRADRVW
jgi:NAD(P)-dependent dehydrogenase (short-subunit alcohol dehydrogenase family)